ncbi:uncharacterized protein LOC100374460 [Saccoglossus kowalevskii]|uniref:Uncharacterized protein LOC100374460 n=1 Tax=Saccoglossus kowalevskii TaxID=10224 RepID=A0ABM0GLK1_SACKO|nr:PREDICTED: uncharacterized protein LOC100374460 [Saccoglossus kowalevskii]
MNRTNVFYEERHFNYERGIAHLCVERFMVVLYDDILPLCGRLGQESREQITSLTIEYIRSLQFSLEKQKKRVSDNKLLHDATQSFPLHRLTDEQRKWPRHPYVLLLEMIDLLHGFSDCDEIVLSRLLYYHEKLKPCEPGQRDRNNILESTTICQAKIDVPKIVSWGGSVPCKSLKKPYINGMMARGIFHKCIKEAIQVAMAAEESIKVKLQVVSSGKVFSTAYQLKRAWGKTRLQHLKFPCVSLVPPCTQCQQIYPTVKYHPSPTDHRPALWPFGNCAENYAFSRLINKAGASVIRPSTF